MNDQNKKEADAYSGRCGDYPSNCKSYANPCETDNGGCSHICTWAGGDNGATCVCPCLLVLDPDDNTTCVADPPCNVDMYVAIDRSVGTDFFACYITQDPAFPDYVAFRDFNVDFFNQFVSLDKGEVWNVGLQTYFRIGASENVTEYTSNELDVGLNAFASTTSPPTCSASTIVQALSRSVLSNNFLLSYSYQGPGTLRPREDTTRIAIVTTSGYMGLVGTVTSTQNILEAVFDEYDAIVVIGRGSSIDGFVLADRDYEFMRYVACRDMTSPCNRVFFFDRVSDDGGLDLTVDNVLSTIDLNACVNRRPNNISEVEVNCENGMTISIPKCQLLGLSLDQLQLIDPNCILSGSDDGVTVTIMIDYVSCGVVFEDDGDTFSFYQRVSTKNFDGQEWPYVEFDVNCSYPAPITFVPPLTGAVENTSSLSNDVFDFAFSLDADFTEPLASGDCVEVNCDIYFKITTFLIEPYGINLYSCFASASDDPDDTSMQYVLADDACPVDSSFVVLNSTDRNCASFTFTMFEFAETYFEEKEEKLEVFLHCYLSVCTPSDTSQRCMPSCPVTTRRRRSAENVHAATLGPFYVERKREEILTESEPAIEEQKEIVIIVEEPVKDDYPNKSVYWILLASFGLCIFYLYHKRRSEVLSHTAGDFPPKYDACQESVEIVKSQPILKDEKD